MRPQPLARLRDSARLMRERPMALIGLGGALLLSLGAVCCGLGLFAAPWFACELGALQLGSFTGHRVERSFGWVRAALLQAVAVLVVSAGGMLAATALGGVPADAPLVEDSGLNASYVLLSAAGVTLALVYLAPFVFAPFILIDRGGRVGGALIESSRLVVTSGLPRHLIFSLVSHAIQMGPALLLALGASMLEDASAIPLALLLAGPLLAVTVPLGQGMIVTGYALRRGEIPPAEQVPRAFEPPRALAAVLVSVSVVPAVALMLVGASMAVRPSRPQPGRAPPGEVVAEAELGDAARPVYVRDTTLEIDASSQRVSVVASDGGGAGAIPLPARTPLDRIRVVRVRDAYAVELISGERRWVTWVDGAGVRLDDHLPARLADHLPAAGLLVVVLTMLVASVMVAWTLAPLGEVRRQAALKSEARTADDELRRRYRGAVRRGWIIAGILAPAAGSALYLSLRALGLGT